MSDESTTAAPGIEPKQYTSAEMKAQQQKRIDFYKQSTKLLEVQYRYEDLLAKIEEARFRRIEAMQKTAYYYDQMEKIAATAERAEKPAPVSEQQDIPSDDPSTMRESVGEKRQRKLKTN